MAATTVDEGEGLGYSQVTAVSGKKTEQYRKVQANLSNIVETLKVNEGAKDSLCLKCEEKRWIDTGQDPPPKKLINIILNRIEHDVDTYDEFMAILDSIEGLDLVKKEIEKPFSQEETQNLSSTSAEPVSGYVAMSKNRPKQHNTKWSANDSHSNEATDSRQDTETDSKKGKTAAAQKKDITCKPPQITSPPSPSQDFMDFSPTEVGNIPIMDLETTTVESSEAYPNSQGVMIPGNESVRQYKETICQMMKLGEEAMEQAETKERELEEKVKYLEENLEQVRYELTSLKEEVKTKDEKLKTLASEIAKKDEEIAKNEEEIAALQICREEMRKNFETEKAEKEKLEKELQQVRSKLAKLESDQKKTKEDIEAMRKEFDRKIELKCAEGLREQLRKAEQQCERIQKERDEERQRAQKERDEDRQRAQKERDEERERAQKERDEERQRAEKERDEQRQRAETLQRTLDMIISKIPHLNIQNTKNNGK